MSRRVIPFGAGICFGRELQVWCSRASRGKAELLWLKRIPSRGQQGNEVRDNVDVRFAKSSPSPPRYVAHKSCRFAKRSQPTAGIAIKLRNRGQVEIVPWTIWRHGNVEPCGFAQLSTSSPRPSSSNLAIGREGEDATSLPSWLNLMAVPLRGCARQNTLGSQPLHQSVAREWTNASRSVVQADKISGFAICSDS